MENHVYRHARVGSWVLINAIWYYASHDLLTKNHPDLDLHPADNVRKGLEAVSNGKTYAFVGNLAVVGHVIGEAGLTNLKISGQTPYRFELSMAVRNDWPELIPILQKALDSITTDERNAIYGRWVIPPLLEGFVSRITRPFSVSLRV